MFRYLLRRLWANTLLYILFATGTYSALSYPWLRIPSLVAIALSTTWLLSTFTYAINEERRLSLLGKHAPLLPSFLPWGVDTIFRALYAFSQWRNHEFWYWMFDSNGNDFNRFTVEEITVGQRIIFTADEENLKAVLATRFADFGKGEQFRKEWKDFLGLSTFSFPLSLWSLLSLLVVVAEVVFRFGFRVLSIVIIHTLLTESARYLHNRRRNVA